MHRLSQRAYIPVVFLFVLCLLECGPVLVRDLFPAVDLAALPPMQNFAMTLGCFGLLAALMAIRSRVSRSRASRPFFAGIWTAAATGLTLFVIPTCLSVIAARYIPPLTVAALETLAPLFCLLLEPYLASSAATTTDASQTHYGILPALAVFSGVLLIFPVFVPSSYLGALGFACALLAAFSLGAGNCLATRIATDHPSLPTTAATATLSAALMLGILSFALEQPRLHRSMLNPPTFLLFASELCALALLFWLTRRLRATPLATRVIWTLLFPILIEAAALPIRLSARNWIGLALMASGAAILLLPARRPATPPGSIFTSEL